MEPTETMHCPSCKATYANRTSRNYSVCTECGESLVDGARMDEIEAEEVGEDEPMTAQDLFETPKHGINTQPHTDPVRLPSIMTVGEASAQVEDLVEMMGFQIQNSSLWTEANEKRKRVQQFIHHQQQRIKTLEAHIETTEAAFQMAMNNGWSFDDFAGYLHKEINDDR